MASNHRYHPWLSATLLFVLFTSPAASYLAAQQPSHNVAPHERDALIALYRATEGEHWTKHDGWLGEPGTECSWYGVTCYERADKPVTVDSLVLSENNLRGPIPEQITQLKGLHWFVIFGNHLSGMVPSALKSRWLEGQVVIAAEANLLTDISEIDYEYFPSAVLCASHRVILRADGSAVMYSEKCRNATPKDRRTFCEVKEGKNYGFALLAHLLEAQGFFELGKEYDLNITDSVFQSTRVVRGGKGTEVVEYAGGAPFALWAINRAIEGVGASVEWGKTSTQTQCPRWKSVAEAR